MHPPPEDLDRNPGMCPDWELNWWPFGSQSSVQYTEQHQPGLISYLLHYIFTVAFLCLDMFRYTNTYLCVIIAYSTCGKHQAMAESGPPPCFYPAAAPSSHLTVKEQLHLHSPKITFGPLKATSRLMWPPVKMSLTPRPTVFSTVMRCTGVEPRGIRLHHVA